MGLLDHQALAIIQGVGKVPSDDDSAEQDLVIVNLMDAAAGFSLVEWSPNIPSLKGGGVWADSSISDGRVLVAGVNTNVTETMVIQLTGATYQAYAAQFAKLFRMAQDARTFWDAFGQIEPVYLRWWAADAPGPQFALIFNIDMDVDIQDGEQAQAQITLTVEREYGWRGLAPGDNPKHWFYIANGQAQQWNVDNAKLYTGSDHLLTQTIANRHELQLDYVTPISQNYVDIPAEDIPGDLPALVYIDATRTSGTPSDVTDVFIAKSTKPTTQTSHATAKSHKTLSLLNGGDAKTGGAATVTKTASADGVISNGSTTNEHYVTVTFGANPQSGTLTWGNNSTLISTLDANTLRGRYAIFFRHKQNSGALGDCEVGLEIRLGPGVEDTTQVFQSISLPAVSSSTLVGSLAGGTWGLQYMGEISIPFGDKAMSSADGFGLDVAKDSQLSLQFIVTITRTTGASSFRFLDLVLMPLDEAFIHIPVPADPAGRASQDAGDAWHMVYDNSGYLGHGDPGAKAIMFFEKTAGLQGPGFNLDLRGGELFLTPKVNNRLFFLISRIDGSTGSSVGQKGQSPIVRLNIIPRWSGIRDV